MLTERELQFIKYWQAERETQGRFATKLRNGLPMATIFALPIILFILAVYLWFPDWYMKVSGTTSGSFFVIVIAVFLCILFFAYFRMHFKWEMNEQLYKELKQKQRMQDAAESSK